MALFFIEYDLRKSRDYEKLYDELARFNAVEVLESTYCFHRYQTTAERLRNHFAKFIDSDDGLCVTEIADWSAKNTNGSPDDLNKSNT